MSSREGELVVAPGLNTDGVNPYHGSNMKYSCWPLIFSIYKIPKFIRNKSDALLLYGVVPSRDFGLNNGIEPDLHIPATYGRIPAATCFCANPFFLCRSAASGQNPIATLHVGFSGLC